MPRSVILIFSLLLAWSSLGHAYQPNIRCWPCLYQGVYMFQLRCDNGAEAQVHIDDPKAPNILTWFSPDGDSGVVYASEKHLEEVFSLACGE